MVWVEELPLGPRKNRTSANHRVASESEVWSQFHSSITGDANRCGLIGSLGAESVLFSALEQEDRATSGSTSGTILSMFRRLTTRSLYSLLKLALLDLELQRGPSYYLDPQAPTKR